MAIGIVSSPAARQEAGGPELPERDGRGEAGGGDRRPPQVRQRRPPARRAGGEAPSVAAASCEARVDAAEDRQHRAHDERHGDERLADGHEPPRAPPVDRRGVERDQDAEADRHRRRGERQHQPGVEQAPGAPGRGDGRGRRAARCRRATTVATAVVRSEIPIAATGSTPMLMPGRGPRRARACARRRASGRSLAAQRTLDERDERGHHDERRAGGDGRHEPSLPPAARVRAGGRAAAAPAPGCDGVAATSTRRRPAPTARSCRTASAGGDRRGRRAASPGARSRPRSSSCRRRRAPGSRRTR